MFIYVCVCLNRILLNHRNECNPAICDNMDWLWGIMLSKVRQTEKEKYHMIFIQVWMASLVAQIVKNLHVMQETRVWSLGQEYKTNKWKTHRYREQNSGYQRVRWFRAGEMQKSTVCWWMVTSLVVVITL